MEEVINAGYALANGDDPDPPSAALLTAFLSDDANAPWNAVREEFADPEFPAIGADFLAETCPADARARIVIFERMYDFADYAVSFLVHRCGPETLVHCSEERCVG